MAVLFLVILHKEKKKTKWFRKHSKVRQWTDSYRSHATAWARRASARRDGSGYLLPVYPTVKHPIKIRT